MFKKGDRVRCIHMNVKNSYYSETYTAGKVYLITDETPTLYRVTSDRVDRNLLFDNIEINNLFAHAKEYNIKNLLTKIDNG